MMNRRTFLASSAAAAAAGAAGARGAAAAERGAPLVLIFTKHLQFIPDYEQMARTAAELGFDGLDVAVRPGGHIEPANAERDIPRMALAAKNAGARVGMITTAIQDAAAPEAEAIFAAGAGIGVRVFRIGGWKYPEGKPIPETLAEIGGKLAGIAALARKHGVSAAYQNHSGAGNVGASIWDLWTMMKDLDAQAMGINFDIGHATVEGGYNWKTDFDLVAPRTKALTIKDFRWEKGEGGRWNARWSPLGEGMIDVPELIRRAKASFFAGPYTMHFEYEPKGAEGAPPHEALKEAMRRDLKTMRGWLKS